MRKVLESNLDELRRRIVEVAKDDLELGFLHAEFDFEWMLRRMVLCFATCPTLVVRSILKDCYGLEAYLDAWGKCVVPFRSGMPWLGEVLGIASPKKVKASKVGRACRERHFLVHGVRNGMSIGKSLVGIDVFLDAMAKMVKFATDNDVDLFGRLSPRRIACTYCTNKDQQKKGDASGACLNAHGQLCPFRGDKKTSALIRNGVRRQRNIRKNPEKGVPIEEVVRLAVKYGLDESAAVAQKISERNKQ